MFSLDVEAYPHDLASRLGEERLDRLCGEVGVTGVALWASSPPLVAVQRYGDAVGIIRSSGGLLYRPGEGAFASTICQPVVARLAEAADSMARALEVCDRLGLRVRFVASIGRSGQLARRHGELAAVNAFAIRSKECICVSHGEVGRYAVCLAESLQELNRNRGVVLRDLLCGCKDVGEVAPLGAAGRWLLSWCFCDGCLAVARRAGVDVDEVRRNYHDVLAGAIDAEGAERERPGDVWAALAGGPLGAYRATQFDTGRALLRAIHQTGTAEVVFDPEGPGDPVASPDATPQYAVPSFEGFEGLLQDRTPPLEVLIPAVLAASAASGDLTAFFKAVADAGADGVTVRPLSMIPEEAIQPLKQAMRFARRTVVA